MIFSNKKIFGLLVAIVIFLVPVSLQFQETGIIDSGTINLISNQADALSIGECGTIGDATLGNCFANGILTFYELLFFTTTQIFVVIAGLLSDIFISFSIDSSFYKSSGFIEAGWEILRDLTNILFIFSLLLIAFKMVLGQNDSSNKKNLVKTILVALFINFSLFITYAIIDSSNLLAHTFYNRLETDTSNYSPQITETDENNESISVDDGSVLNIAEYVRELGVDKAPSLAIASQINPQRIINGAGGETGFLVAMVLVTGMAIMNIFLIYIFLSVTLLFLGRIIGLLMLAIMSPVAFASLAIPSLRKQKYVGWDNWFPDLIKLSFMAPLYLFFLWLVATFLTNAGVLATLNKPGVNWITSIINAYILLFIVGGLLLLAKKVTENMSGEIGALATKAVGAAIGGTVAVAAVAATGGAAALGGGMRVLGAGSKTAVGRAGKRLASSALRTKIDVTKIPGFSSVAGKDVTGMIGKVTGRSALGQISAAKTSFVKNKGAIVNDETSLIGKEAIERAKLEAKRKAEKNKSAEDWQREAQKEREKGLAEEIKVTVDAELDGTGFIKKFRDEEKAMYRDMIADPTSVKAEEKALKDLDKELADLNSIMNAAKGSGNNALAKKTKSDIDTQKVVIDARKKGKDISKTEAADLIIKNGGNTEFTKTSDEGTYATIGTGAENLKSRYEKQRKETQENEAQFLKTRVKDLRDTGEDKEADLLSKKIPELLTDSSKKKNLSDGDDKK